MFKVELEITSLKEYLRKLRRWQGVADTILDKHLDNIVRTAKDLAPVDTGFMRENIKKVGTIIAEDIVRGEILSAAHYSSYVEYGTEKQNPQPFLNPATEVEIASLIEDLVLAFETL